VRGNLQGVSVLVALGAVAVAALTAVLLSAAGARSGFQCAEGGARFISLRLPGRVPRVTVRHVRRGSRRCHLTSLADVLRDAATFSATTYLCSEVAFHNANGTWIDDGPAGSAGVRACVAVH
jgi:hypothetical protein